MDIEKNKISKIQIKVPLQNIKKNVREFYCRKNKA